MSQFPEPSSKPDSDASVSDKSALSKSLRATVAVGVTASLITSSLPDVLAQEQLVPSPSDGQQRSLISPAAIQPLGFYVHDDRSSSQKKASGSGKPVEQPVSELPLVNSRETSTPNEDGTGSNLSQVAGQDSEPDVLVNAGVNLHIEKLSGSTGNLIAYFEAQDFTRLFSAEQLKKMQEEIAIVRAATARFKGHLLAEVAGGSDLSQESIVKYIKELHDRDEKQFYEVLALLGATVLGVAAARRLAEDFKSGDRSRREKAFNEFAQGMGEGFHSNNSDFILGMASRVFSHNEAYMKELSRAFKAMGYLRELAASLALANLQLAFDRVEGARWTDDAQEGNTARATSAKKREQSSFGDGNQAANELFYKELARRLKAFEKMINEFARGVREEKLEESSQIAKQKEAQKQDRRDDLLSNLKRARPDLGNHPLVTSLDQELKSVPFMQDHLLKISRGMVNWVENLSATNAITHTLFQRAHSF